MLIKYEDIKEPLDQFRVKPRSPVESQLEAISARRWTTRPTFDSVGPAKKSASRVWGGGQLSWRTGYQCRSATIMIHVSAILPRQSRIFGGWPRGGRAGLERFDKTRIDAGTPHGLPRVTVNGISAPTAHRETPYLAFNYDFDFDFVAVSWRSFFCPRFYSGIAVHFRLTFGFASRLLTKITPDFTPPLYFLKEDS